MHKEKRLGLVLSGGGRNGAFASGAIHALRYEHGVIFDVISGTSTGALQAPLVALDKVRTMSNLYQTVTNKDILDSRNIFFAWLRGAMNGTKPLKNLINKYVDIRELESLYPDKKAIVNAVSLRTGKLITCDNSPKRVDYFKEFTLASASIPFLMDAVKIRGEYFVDGGLVDIAPLNSMDKEDVDHIVVIVNEPKFPERLKKAPKGLFAIAKRSMSIVATEIIFNDSFRSIVNKPIHYIFADKHYGDSLEFKPKVMKKIWMDGYDKVMKMSSKDLSFLT